MMIDSFVTLLFFESFGSCHSLSLQAFFYSVNLKQHT